jgi:NAD(P)-dependent dehydrogenase (short-subunit alcohol dehydrogenase family)
MALGMTSNGRALSGKTMLVTGAAKRLGRAIALAAAENGADVAITYRESAREARALVTELAKHDVDALAVRCDVTDEQNVREMVKEVARELGGIDVLVNNAANYATVEFEKITLAQWDAMFASNTRGPVSGLARGAAVSKEARRPHH